ncbi:MAG: LPS assembly lipoprotein LptE [Candidatus Omnitrophota bacterium]|nr:hypothetical protein [Candidatus Omnitrophota bacterium]
MTKWLWGVVLVVSLSGCGYTTKGFVYEHDRIVVVPAVDKISITAENRKYSQYQSYPVLLEKRFTSVLVGRFNRDGHLKVTSNKADALLLECVITDYQKEAVRYSDSDDVREQRLRLHVLMKLSNARGETIKERDVVGESSFFLVGPNRKSEAVAQGELIDDAARRIVEAVVEEW